MKSKLSTKKKLQKSKPKAKWVCYVETPKENVDRLIEVYKKDRIKAKVLYSQNKSSYQYYKLLKFERPDGSFDLVIYNVKYGMSITNIIYKRQSVYQTIIYKDKKFWYKANINKNKIFKPLAFWDLHNLLNTVFSSQNYYTNPMYLELETKFGWIRNIRENERFHGIPFNTLINKKIFGVNDIIRHMYKCPLPVAKMIIENTANYNQNDFLKMWKEMKKVLINVENLKAELFKTFFFIDSCKMAAQLGEKVNCSWSPKRLKAEHDSWSKKITNIVIELEPHKELNVLKTFKNFAEFSGYKLLASNHDLMYEGREMEHCVATYISAVDSGRSGIYHVGGHTLELRIKKGVILGTNDHIKPELYVGQFHGYRNCNAPSELTLDVVEKVNEFNKTLKAEEIAEEEKIRTKGKYNWQLVNDENPF